MILKLTHTCKLATAVTLSLLPTANADRLTCAESEVDAAKREATTTLF